MNKKNQINLIEIKEKIKEKIGGFCLDKSASNKSEKNFGGIEELNNSYRPKSIHKPNFSCFAQNISFKNLNLKARKSPSPKREFGSLLNRKKDMIFSGKLAKYFFTEI